jgi:hypothetical protein
MFGITEVQNDMAAEKRRRDKKDRDEALTAAHAAEEAGMEAMRGENGRSDGDGEAEAARKAIADIGCEPGPGVFGEPHDMAPAGSYDRPYLHDGTAAPSPMHQAPNPNPLPPEGRGILTPLPQSAEAVVAGPGLNGPIMQGMAAHQARAGATMPRMPIPGRSA